MTPQPLPTLARWDDPGTLFDGPAVVAAPVVALAQRMDAAQFGGSVRLSLIWKGNLRPAAPPGGLCAGVPSTSSTQKEPRP